MTYSFACYKFIKKYRNPLASGTLLIEAPDTVVISVPHVAAHATILRVAPLHYTPTISVTLYDVRRVFHGCE